MYSLSELQHALDEGQFFIEYMPTVALPDGHCVGAETLIRWQRGSEVIYPNDFIPQCENTWLSGRITYWVFETVAHELLHWLKVREHVRIGINVPPEIIGRGGMSYAARNCGLIEVADKIMLEVTERGLLDGLGVSAINHALKSGLNVALDDLGVNDASLLVLSRVGAGIVKLDKQFVDDMLQPDWELDKIAGLAALVHAGDLQVIAEGVECKRQVDILAEAGVQMAQGFYFARSMPAGEFMEYFDRNAAGPH